MENGVGIPAAFSPVYLFSVNSKVTQPATVEEVFTEPKLQQNLHILCAHNNLFGLCLLCTTKLVQTLHNFELHFPVHFTCIPMLKHYIFLLVTLILSLLLYTEF